MLLLIAFDLCLPAMLRPPAITRHERAGIIGILERWNPGIAEDKMAMGKMYF